MGEAHEVSGLRLISHKGPVRDFLGFEDHEQTAREEIGLMFDELQRRYEKGASPESLAFVSGFDLAFVRSVLAYWPVVS